MLVAVSPILFSGGAGYWLWVTEYHDKAITAWTITISWYSVSAFCLLIGLFAALLYALPYIADIQGLIEDPSNCATLLPDRKDTWFLPTDRTAGS